MPHGIYWFLAILSRVAYVKSTESYESYLIGVGWDVDTIGGWTGGGTVVEEVWGTRHMICVRGLG